MGYSSKLAAGADIEDVFWLSGDFDGASGAGAGESVLSSGDCSICLLGGGPTLPSGEGVGRWSDSTVGSRDRCVVLKASGCCFGFVFVHFPL